MSHKAACEYEVGRINRLLEDKYGTLNDRPNYRIVWSDDQYELRYGTYEDYLPEGMYLRTVTETRNVQKYIHYIRERWVLERLTVINEIVDGGPVDKLSYEPLWVFETKNGDALPPIWLAAKLVVETVNSNIEGAGNYVKYKESDTVEQKAKQLKEYKEALWGNETDVTDALHRGFDGKKPSGIVVPGPNEKTVH